MPRLSPIYELLWRVRLGSICRSALVLHGVDHAATTPGQMAKLLNYFDQRRDLVANVAVHFDDAYESITPWVTELASRGIAVTIFVPTDIVGMDYMGRQVCSWRQLSDMSRYPSVSVQSHAASHTNLTRLELSDVESELRRSKVQLEQRMGSPVTEIAYPRGKCNYDIVTIATECGYSRGWTVNKGHLGCADAQQMMLPRVVAQPRESMASAMGQCLSGTCNLHRLAHR